MKYENGYQRVDELVIMRQLLKDNYVLKDIEIDTSNGFCTATFDIENKSKDIRDIMSKSSGVHVEKLFNVTQINYYLTEDFDCTVVDVGIDKRKLKNGDYKNFFYVKFLYDENLKVPKKKWMSNDRK